MCHRRGTLLKRFEWLGLKTAGTGEIGAAGIRAFFHLVPGLPSASALTGAISHLDTYNGSQQFLQFECAGMSERLLSERSGRAMDSLRLLTAEEVAELDEEDGFEPRWTELVGGRIVSLEPPALEHGAVVLNLTKAMARYLQLAQEENGYACFELGLVVARNPDTVRRPPVSFFVGG